MKELLINYGEILLLFILGAYCLWDERPRRIVPQAVGAVIGLGLLTFSSYGITAMLISYVVVIPVTIICMTGKLTDRIYRTGILLVLIIALHEIVSAVHYNMVEPSHYAYLLYEAINILGVAVLLLGIMLIRKRMTQTTKKKIADLIQSCIPFLLLCVVFLLLVTMSVLNFQIQNHTFYAIAVVYLVPISFLAVILLGLMMIYLRQIN